MEDPLLNPERRPEEELGPFPPPPIGLETDPFYAFRDELAHTMRKSMARVEKIQLAANSEEVFSEVASMRKGMTSLKENVSHLERLVSHVERKRADFSHLSDEEIKSRRTFLKAMQARLKQIDLDLTNANSLGEKLAEQERAQQRIIAEAKLKAITPPPRKVLDDDEHDDIEHQRFMQQQVLQDQDESLEDISSSLNRLYHAGNEMYQEIDSHNQLLNEVNEEAYSVTSKMDSTLSRLDKVLHSKSRGQTIGIGFLVLVLIIEIIIVATI
jgi:primosomal protein N''